MGIKEFLYLCLGKWRWFVLSVAVILGLAVVYLLVTPPVYTRSTTLLLKLEQGPRSSLSEAAGVLGDLNLFQSYTNVNNEIISLQSPALMTQVVRRLGLNENYSTDGTFHKEVLYGLDRSYIVDFSRLGDNDAVSFTIVPMNDGSMKLEDFRLDGEKVKGNISAVADSLTVTPIGEIVISEQVPLDSTVIGKPVYVSRIGYAAAGKAYAENLYVGQDDDESTVINLSIEDVSPQRAEDLLNTVIAIYNENWLKDKNQVAVSNSMFIEDRLAVIEQKLGTVDKDIAAYKSENLLPDVQAAAGMYMTQSSENNAQILELNIQLSMAKYIRNYLMSSTGANQLLPTNSGIESSGIENQIAEYNSLQLQRNNLVAASSENNPLVRDMDDALVAMRSAILTSIDNHITTLGTQIDAMEQNEQKTTARIASAPEQGQYLLSVERQQKVKETLYLFLLQKREENELSQAFTAYNTRVITPPSGEPYPTSPETKKILLIAFILGLFIPAAVIFALEAMNTKLRGRKDLENLTMPFAGEIPLAESKNTKRRLIEFAGKVARRKKAEEENKGVIVIKPGKRDVTNEAFRVLRTNVEFMLDSGKEGGKTDVCIVTSFNPGSGKTFITMNMAASFAIKGKRILVIDGDLRKGSSSEYVGSPSKGISNYLAKRVDSIEGLIVEVPGYKGLDVLPVGTLPPNPAELLAEPRFAELIESLRSRYDLIFIDCPPIDIVADTQIISKVADRTIFIVRAGLLEREMIPELQRNYDEQRFRNMALILNGTESAGTRYGYKYGYHYGYHYGYGSDSYYGSSK